MTAARRAETAIGLGPRMRKLYALCGFWGCVTIIIATILTLNASGFCYGRVRWLSDKELIDAAVDHEISWRLRFKEYKSRADFYSKNPRCCLIERFPSGGAMLPGFGSSLLGFWNARVELFYKQSEEPPHEGPYYDANVGVGACGEIGEWWGIDSRENERPRGAKTWSEQ